NVQCEVPLPRASDHEQESSFLSPANTKGGSTTEHRPKVRLCSLDLLIRVPESCGPQETVREVLGDRSPKEEGKEPLESTTLLLEEDNLEKECPICTELYDSYNHKQSFLNCKHMLCRYCIKTIMDKSNQANMGRLTCPICRQKTPMLQWEICKLQDQLMDSGGTQIQQVEIPPEPLVRRPGLCGALEYRFQKRFYTTRMFTFAPCFRYPVRFINLLHGLERRCRCLYLCVLAFLLCVETVCFFVVFLPIVILVLFIVFSK
ncbi:ring finger protein-like, partial [Rhinophrynus dorsalis]